MSVGFRTLWLCLLLLALPVQATLAATTALCAGHRHGDAAAHPMGGAMAVAIPDAMPGSTTGGPADHDACVHALVSDDGIAIAATQASDLPAADAPCSACAACCAPAAMPVIAGSLPAAEPMPAVFSAVQAAVETFAGGGPDRPPRSAAG
jgi:hypothetical protein